MECYEGEVQPYRKTDYKPIIYIYMKDIIIITGQVDLWIELGDLEAALRHSVILFKKEK